MIFFGMHISKLSKFFIYLIFLTLKLMDFEFNFR